MILYEIFPNKTLKPIEDENTYITENLISSVHIKLPSTFGDYPVKELTAELRFYFPEGNYMAYAVDTQQARPEVPITNDITEKPQTLSVMLFFYKGGNVIGKTNSVDKVILDAPLKGEPLTPRAEFDEVIAEQRETIAEQAETITEQAETISSQGEQITELNGEVTELTTENTRLEALTETQRETIQNMLDNPPQPKLYTPPVVTPSGIVQQISPPTGYDGLTNTVVDRVSAAVDPDIVPENIREGVDILGVEGTYNPFPERSYGGIYYTELGEGGYPKKILIKDMLRSASTIPQFFNTSNDAKRELREVIFENCPGFLTTAANLFQGFNYLAKVLLPDSLTSIGQYAFHSCTSLTEINLPDSLTSIGQHAFNSCTSLTEINLPDSLTSIGQHAFNSCTSLTRLTLPDSLTSIGGDAFRNCTSLTELTLPDSLTSIGQHAFNSCTSLTRLTLPDSLTSIGYSVFYNCTSLTELTLPDSLTSIGDDAFRNCTSLTELTLPDSLTSIGQHAFNSCTSLTELTLAQGFNCNGLNVSSSTRFTAETIVACLEALADRTGQTAYTITFGSTNLNKLTAEQRAIATNKNWNLA